MEPLAPPLFQAIAATSRWAQRYSPAKRRKNLAVVSLFGEPSCLGRHMGVAEG